MNEKKQLSLCMVTKNDEKYLVDSLKEFKEVADETVLVDIGSTDRTVELARQEGAQVYQMEWTDSWSEAKNLCLEHAAGRWVLFLQPGEMVPEEHRGKIRELLMNPNVEGYLFHLDGTTREHTVSSPVQSLRLFRNRKEYRFQYRSFERIPDEQINALEPASVRIVHRDDTALFRELGKRIPLVQKDLEERPLDSYVRYLAGMELLNQKKYEESVPHFQAAIAEVNFDDLFAPHLLKCLGWAYLCLQKYEEALNTLSEGIKNFPVYSDYFILRAEIHKQLGQYGEALQDLDACLKIKEQAERCVPCPEIGDFVLFETLGEIHEQLSNSRQALACYQRAYELNSAKRGLLHKIGRLIHKTASVEVMEHLLKLSVEQKNPERLAALMEILFQQREYVKVLDYMEALESLLGKGEQTESIRLSCRLMLGEEQEDFSAIGKESPFYSQILLLQIQNRWFRDQFPQAEQLLAEMDDTQGIDEPVKALHRFIQELLTGKETYGKALLRPEYETAAELHDHFLWLGQEEKAKVLLSFLLKQANDDDFINLARAWARGNHFEIIEMIFRCISDEEKQKVFKQKVIEQLLSDEKTELAKQVIQLGKPQAIGDLEYVLWARFFMKNLQEWIRKTQAAVGGKAETQAVPDRQYKELLAFFNRLHIVREPEKDNFHHGEWKLTCAEIHKQTGIYYEKMENRTGALTAYLRTLQWEPLNEHAQERISCFFEKDPELFHVFLVKSKWAAEGEWFQSKREFENYIYGFIHFRRQLFEQSLSFFIQNTEDEAVSSVSMAYRIAILWIEGKRAEAENQLNQLNETSGLLPLIFSICKNYALCRLEEGVRKYPYSERIRSERERIRSKSR
ncbi:glycosyltransferase [Caproiciproducens faecalis]|uniref:Tetratricopeptide repeat protein n=1 Tax=Caproiciproducens faecalis TaxID=2820301 RepID=A0ABS7DM14_9FIRM|nr:glycosyltransferase [Caproiciproducens faecalis]MBW7572344.1 tetratricopeptide repeat protein [Caproiciproducens faecalis]